MRPRNATDGETGIALKPKQRTVLELLLTGMSISEAARSCGVDRGTVHRWLRDDGAFQAALNRGQRTLRRASEARLEVLAAEALDAVRRAVQDGDARTAIGLLRGLGMLSGQLREIGSEDPATVRQLRMAHQRRERAVATNEDVFSRLQVGCDDE
jgi:AcrR family transcriptional regulator